ncbi:MAG TPA: DUF3800 domain-containing protein, partial [Candidatus Polarisedimenticolia bacterium]
MYICYLDESGTRESQANSSHFVLLGLAIPADTWKVKDLRVVEAKAKYGLQKEEVHTAWMARDYPEQATVPGFDHLPWPDRRRAVLGVRALNLSRPRTREKQGALLKNYRKTEAYVHLTRVERRNCLEDLATLIGSRKDARAFADAQDKRRTAGVPGFDFAFEQVVTRFNTFLASTKGLYGLLVQDNNQTVAQRLTDAMRKYHRDGTMWRRLDRVVETPLFVDSALTSMIQLADLCAYATRRFFEHEESDLFLRIYS